MYGNCVKDRFASAQNACVSDAEEKEERVATITVTTLLDCLR